MSNSKKTREAEQRAQMAEQQTRQAQAAAETARLDAAQKASEKIQITPEAQKVLTQSGKDFDSIRSGRLTDVPMISNFLNNQAAANETADRESATGIFALAEPAANSNLIAMQREKNKSLRARDTAAGVSALAADAEDAAVGRIGSISGMDLGARSSLVNFMFQNAGLAQNNVSQNNDIANTAWQRYQMEKQHRTFGQQLLSGAVAGAAGIASSYFGRPGK